MSQESLFESLCPVRSRRLVDLTDDRSSKAQEVRYCKILDVSRTDALGPLQIDAKIREMTVMLCDDVW